MTDVDSRAVERAKTVAWDVIAPRYHEGAAEAAENALLEDDLWTWLVAAAERAEEMETYRRLELDSDDQRHDEIHGHLGRAHGHLSQARDRRRDDLLDAALDEFDPDALSPGDLP